MGFIILLPYSNALVSWNYRYHGIEQARTKSTGSESAFIIDTGTSPDQANLGSGSNEGASNPDEPLKKIVTLPRKHVPLVYLPGWKHLPMVAVMVHRWRVLALHPVVQVARRAGIAYNCNLVTCRAAADVYPGWKSTKTKACGRYFLPVPVTTDVRIISTSGTHHQQFTNQGCSNLRL